MRAEKPEHMIEEAVWGMLPKNKIGRKMLKKLKVYRGTNHPHAAQKPDHMAHRFEHAEEWAKSFDDPARDEWQMPARVIDALALQPGQIVADIGAGTGYFTIRLA